VWTLDYYHHSEQIGIRYNIYPGNYQNNSQVDGLVTLGQIMRRAFFMLGVLLFAGFSGSVNAGQE
tara:strand:- start:227 stop:421 length:195 start_codon:yes stop_codon:yes gene_type:complete